MTRTSPRQLSGRWLAFAFLLLAAGIGALWYSASSAYEKAVLRERGRELQAIAELKIEFIRFWLNERRSDALVQSQRPLLAIALTGLDADQWPYGLAALPGQLGAIRKEYGYEAVMLLDHKGAHGFSAGTVSDYTLASAAKAAQDSMAEGRVVVSRAYHAESGGRRHTDIDIAAPVVSSRLVGTRTVGSLVFHLDPREHLDPLLKQWPAPSESGETFLFERIGEEIVYLSSLRHADATDLRRHIDDPYLPAALAARGGQGVIEGLDYRGVPVLAAVGQVPGMPWFVVSKLDRDEILAPVRREALWSGALASLLVLALGLATLFWHRRGQSDLALAQQVAAQTALAASEARFRRLHEHAWDFNALVDRNMIIRYASPTLDRYLGHHSVGETIGVGTARVHPDDVARVEAARRAALKQPGKPQFVEHRFASGDGSWLTVEACFTNYLDDPEIGALAYSARDITQRRIAERALHESEVRLHAIFEHAPLGIAIVDSKGRYAMVNPAQCRMLGYSEAELLGKSFRDVTLADDADLNEKMALEMIQGRIDHFALEKRYLRKDGQPIWVTLSVGAVRDERGALRYFVGLLEDISERKRMEDALRENEARYRFLFAGCPLPMWVYDVETLAFIEVNDAAIAHYGYTREEFLAMNVRDLVVPEQVGALEGVMGQPDEARWGRIWTNRRKDGSRIETAVWSRSMDYAGRPARMVLTEDVTERIRAQAALRDSEERYRFLFELSPDAVFVHRNSIVLYANNAAYRLFGAASTQDLIGKDWHGLLSPEDWSIAEQRVAILENGTTSSLPPSEQHFITLDGRPIQVEAASARIVIDGEPAIISVFRDITERKRAEAELKESENTLRTFLDTIPGVVIVMDTKGAVHYANRLAAESLGVKLEQMIGANAFSFLPADVAARRLAKAEQAMLENRAIRFEDSRDGRDIDSIFCPVPDSRGIVFRLAVLAFDITERKQMEQAIRESEARYRYLFKLSPDAVFVHRNNRILYINEAAMRLFKADSEEDLIGRDWHDLVAPEEWPTIEKRVAMLASGEQTFLPPSGLMNYRTLDGEVIQVEATGASIVIDGKPAIIAVIRNLTERMQMENALRDSEATLRSFLDALPAAAFLVRRDDTFGVLNAATAHILKRPRESLIGTSAYALMPPEAAARRKAWVDEVSASKRELVVEEHWRDRWYESRLAPIIGKEGEVTGVAVTTADITERKEGEKRRIELAHQQRDTLVREVHHRIKNHLQGLAGLLRQHMHEQPGLEPVLKKFAAQINAISIVHGLQGRTEQGDASLRNLIAEITAFLGGITGAPVSLNCPAHGCMWAVAETEAVPLALILNELLTNALRHGTDRAQVSLSIQCDGDRALLIIRNPGRLGAGLDHVAGKGLGTGLSLIRSLLPPEGASLFLENTEDGWVETRLELGPPVLLPLVEPQVVSLR